MLVQRGVAAAVLAAAAVLSFAPADCAVTDRAEEVRSRLVGSRPDASLPAVPEAPPAAIHAPSHVAGHGVGSNPFILPGSQVGGALIFETGFGGCLWRTDGSAGGTFQLGDCLRFEGGLFLAPVGPRRVFPALYGGGLQLWATDGSPGGTVPLTAFDSLTALWLNVSLAPSGAQMVFAAYDDTNGFEPWLTDGTPEGTGLFVNVRPGPDSSYPSGYSFLEDGRMLFFVDAQIPPYEVWSSDLTPEGTALAFLLDVPADAYVSSFSAAPQAAVFWVTEFAVPPDSHGSAFHCHLELRRTDGMAAGTYPLAEFVLFGCEGQSTIPVRLGGHRYFEADDGIHGGEIWRTDGTTLERLTDAPGAGPLSTIRLWPVALGGRTVMVLDGGQGRELWRLDEGELETAPLIDLCPGECSGVTGELYYGLTRIAGGVVFEGDDGVSGRELWFSDGTAEGTRMLADICPGACSSGPDYSQAFDGYVLVVADDGSHGDELWRVAVPSGIATRLTDFPSYGDPAHSFVSPGWPLGRCLVFSADDGPHGREPWVSNGTRLGTHLIADLMPDDVVPEGPPRLRLDVPWRSAACDSKRLKRPWWCPCVADAPAPLSRAR